MLAPVHRWIVSLLTPADPLACAVRVEQLHAVARANRQAFALPFIAVLLAFVDLQWVSPKQILPWLASVTAAVIWMLCGSRSVLAEAHGVRDAGRLTLRMLIVCVPLTVLWPTMAAYVWRSGDPVNQAFVGIFLLASMSLSIPQTGYSRHISLAGLAVYFPLLAIFHLEGPGQLRFLSPMLMVVCGALIARLSLQFDTAFSELALRSAEKETLAAELATTAEELARARDQAEEASQLKSKFLANMSHELRTPLNAILGFSDFIRSQMLGPIAPAKYVEYGEHIHRSGQHLLNLINTLLDLAKIEAGRLELQERELNLLLIAEHSIQFVELQARRAEVSLSQEMEQGLSLFADERAITQVLTNLVSNAVKFTPPGGEVTVFSQAIESGMALGVKDTGSGMEPAEVERALEPFVQIAHHATVEGWGAGLGLPLVKALIELHGGTFHIESHRGIGTCAWAEFPGTRTVRSSSDSASGSVQAA